MNTYDMLSEGSNLKPLFEQIGLALYRHYEVNTSGKVGK